MSPVTRWSCPMPRWMIPAVLCLPLLGAARATGQAGFDEDSYFLAERVVRTVSAAHTDQGSADLLGMVDLDARGAERAWRGLSERRWSDLGEAARERLRQRTVQGWAGSMHRFLRRKGARASLYGAPRAVADPDVGRGPVPDRVLLHAVVRRPTDTRLLDLLITTTPAGRLLELGFGKPRSADGDPPALDDLLPAPALQGVALGILHWPENTDDGEYREVLGLVEELEQRPSGAEHERIVKELHLMPRSAVAALLGRAAELDPGTTAGAATVDLLLDVVEHISGRSSRFLGRRPAGMDEADWVAHNLEERDAWRRWHRQHGSSFRGVSYPQVEQPGPAALVSPDPLPHSNPAQGPTLQESPSERPQENTEGGAAAPELPWATGTHELEGRATYRTEGDHPGEDQLVVSLSLRRGRVTGANLNVAACSTAQRVALAAVDLLPGLKADEDLPGQLVSRFEKANGVPAAGDRHALDLMAAALRSALSGDIVLGGALPWEAEPAAPKERPRAPRITKKDGPRDILFPAAADLPIFLDGAKQAVLARSVDAQLTGSLRWALNAWADTALEHDLNVMVLQRMDTVLMGPARSESQEEQQLKKLRKAAQQLEATWDLLASAVPLLEAREPRPIVTFLMDQESMRRDSALLTALLDVLVEKGGASEAWTRELRGNSGGFMMRGFRSVTYVQPDYNMHMEDVFRLENDLVHRFAESLLAMRLGHLPPMIRWAFGCIPEIESTGEVWQFNDSFIEDGCHTGWPSGAESLLKKKKRGRWEYTLSDAAIRDTQSGKTAYADLKYSKITWAALDYLFRHDLESFQALLLGLARLQQEAAGPGGGEWAVDPLRTRELYRQILDGIDRKRLLRLMD